MRNQVLDRRVTRPMHAHGRIARLGPALAAALVLLVGACGPGSGAGSPTPEPQPSAGCGPIETGTPGPACCGTALSEAELRLSLIDQLGPRWYCDPDEYPVAHGDERQRAVERWPEIRDDALTRAIALKLHIDLAGTVDTDAKLAIYQQWKVASSIPLDDVGNGLHRFDYTAQPVAGASEGTRTAGTIDEHGTITVEQQAPSGQPPCPICLARGTPIDTPNGAVAVDRLRIGDPVWTVDAAGRRVAGTVIALGSTTAPSNHHVVALRLADGRAVTASPGHPLPDGRLLGELRVGDLVDGSRVVAANLRPYAGAETFDLVASGDTGIYFAGGIPLGTTLR